MRDVVLYAREGCHLCDEARREILAVRAAAPYFELREIDIDSDDRLLARYLERIPVVTVDGAEISELALDRDRLVAALGRPPLDTVKR